MEEGYVCEVGSCSKKTKAVFACVLRLPEDRNSASGHENSAQECASTSTHVHLLLNLH